MSFIGNIVSGIGSALRTLFTSIRNFIVTVIHGILNFFKEVVGWFKKLRLNPNKHTPFIADAKRLKQLIHEAPEVNVGIFEGVYNEETEEIEHYREIKADNVDAETKRILSNTTPSNPIVVLS